MDIELLNCICGTKPVVRRNPSPTFFKKVRITCGHCHITGEYRHRVHEAVVHWNVKQIMLLKVEHKDTGTNG